MRRLRPLLWVAGLLLIAATWILWRLNDRASTVIRPPVATVDAPAGQPQPAADPSRTDEDVRRTSHVSTSVMPTAAPANRDGRGDVSSAGPRRLAERLKLRPPRPEDDPVTNLLRQHDADELRLLAELQRRTGRPARTEVVELMRQRREGATVEQLRPQVERLFADDLATRMVVLRWLSRNETTGDSP